MVMCCFVIERGGWLVGWLNNRLDARGLCISTAIALA